MSNPADAECAVVPNAGELAQRHWNEMPLYLTESARYAEYPWLYEAAEFGKHAGEHVLEIGCGTGCDLLQFAKHGANATGIDITPEHLRLARERVGNGAQVFYGDGKKIPFEDARFDYVYSHGVLHHLDQPRRMVEEVFRVLRPGGRFNVQVYARWSYWPVLLMLRHGWNWKLWVENSREPVHIDLYDARMLRQLFAPARISVQKFEFKYCCSLEPWLGWFLVAKGRK